MSGTIIAWPGVRGYLNIRLTQDEWNRIYEATGKKGCAFGTPVTFFPYNAATQSFAQQLVSN